MTIWRSLDPGDLDTTFGIGGIVSHDGAAGGNGSDQGWDLATDTSGKIIVAGISFNLSGNRDMAVWRFLQDGSLDTTLGGTGWVVHDDAAGGAGDDVAKGVGLTPGGGITTAGYSLAPDGEFDAAVWRLHPDGSLDGTFGGLGWVTHHDAAGGNAADEATGLVLDAAGRTVVVGISRNPMGNPDMTIWRFDTTGSLDGTFGPGGYVTHHSAAGGDSWDRGSAVTLDFGGRILTTGYSVSNVAGNLDMVIWRYDPLGQLDTAFNARGWVTHRGGAPAGGSAEGRGITVDTRGRILVSGFATNAQGDRDLAIWRYR